LHDTIEDTDTTLEELEEKFGLVVLVCVKALTKDKSLPKEQQMQDSLDRIKKLPKEVWAVKLADRITNMQKPPAKWDIQKKIAYQAEAQIILEALGSGNEYLGKRLDERIKDYSKYL
jgi:guanosine-3',5'-bis(diphosphate) 3'-pyrophosphohydrolase